MNQFNTAGPSRYLVVANLTAESPALQDRVRRLIAQDPGAEFELVVPTYLTSWTLQLLGNIRRPVTLGRMRARRARNRLQAIGASVSSVRLTFHEPFEAIELELGSRRYRGVIISTLPHHISHWLHQDLPGRVARRHPDVEVMHVISSATSTSSTSPLRRSHDWRSSTPRPSDPQAPGRATGGAVATAG
jgi:GABA permease